MRAWPVARTRTLLWFLMGATATVDGHPLGNMCIGHYSALHLNGDTLHVQYVLDFAEIPTFIEAQRHGIVAVAGRQPPTDTFARTLTRELQQGLALRLSGRPVALTASRPCDADFAAGAAGMATLRVSCDFTAPASSQNGRHTVYYKDSNYAQRSGWKEIIFRSEPPWRLLESTVPPTGRSAALTAYPETLPAALPQIVEASVILDRGPAPKTGAAEPSAIRPAPGTTPTR